MRQSRGSIVCPSCGKLIGISEPRCPFCGAWRPGLFGWAPALQHLFRGRLNLVSLIVATCVVLYAVSLLLEPEAITSPRGMLSFLSPGSRALYQLGMTGGIAWQLGWWWTLLTAIYLHGGLLHIFFNMMWVRDLGPVVTEIYGPARAFILFQIGGVAGFLVSNLVTGVPTLGASGSIFGLLAALIAYGRRRGSSLMSTQLWQWAIVLFVMGLLLPAVNNWAHAGGFAGGWVAGYVMRPSDERRESAPLMLAALGLILLTAAGFVLSFVNVTGILLNARP
jgi:rhomboid protease GluP